MEVNETHIRLAESKNSQGNALYKSEKYSNALYFYENAINLNPNEAKYYSNLSACYINLQNYIKALATAQKAIDIDDKFYKCYIRVIKCCLITGNIRHARTTMQVAFKKFKNNEELIQLNKSIELLHNSFENYKTETEKRNYTKALECIDECITEKPDCILFRLEKAKCLINLKEFDEAKIIADEISKTQKYDEDVTYIQTCVECYKLDALTAFPLIKKVKLTNTDHIQITDLYTNTKLICCMNDQFDKALEKLNFGVASNLIEDVINTDSKYTVTIKKLRYHIIIKVPDIVKNIYLNCVKDCEEYLLTYGLNLDVLKKKSKLLMKLHEYEDAIDDFEEILKLENTEENEKNLLKAIYMFENQENYFETGSQNLSKTHINKATSLLIDKYHPDNYPKACLEKRLQLENRIVRLKEAKNRLLDGHEDDFDIDI